MRSINFSTILLVAASSLSLAVGAPFIPSDDDHALERLPHMVAPIRDELRELRARSSDLATAVRLAQKYVRLGGEESDPRYFGYAAGALAPWRAVAAPPDEVRLLRAMIAQNRHDFDGAIAELDAVTQSDPANLQAWLTRASIMKLRGRFDEARASCAPLTASSEPLLAVTCICEIAGLVGGSAEAANVLEQTIAERMSSAPERRRWALTTLAEMAARRGEAERAERSFEAALHVGRPTAYLLAAYAEFLLDEARFVEVTALLGEETRIDAALLRLALAEQRLGAPGFAEHRAMIEERFAAGRRRGEAFHLGDEARFALFLAGDPIVALRLAQENWRVQHSPSDARILYEAAVAAGDAAAAGEARDFLTRAGMDATRLSRLASRASGSSVPGGGR